MTWVGREGSTKRVSRKKEKGERRVRALVRVSTRPSSYLATAVQHQGWPGLHNCMVYTCIQSLTHTRAHTHAHTYTHTHIH